MKRRGPVAFELAVQDGHGLAVAATLAADRIELCSALPLGGVTPSLGLIETAVAFAGIPPVHVLVRPRLGGFDYAPDEADLIVRDVRLAVAAGAAGVVVGGVRDGEVDGALIERVVTTAGAAEVTFHRAFDAMPDPEKALAVLADLGVRRILTSGGSSTVADALPALAELVTAAGDRLEIMAGGGVHPGLVTAIVATGVAAVHASAKRLVPDAAGIQLGTAAPAAQSGRETTDEDEARRLLAALRAADPAR